ncbi:MAG: type II toxin-antitoxin system prevent-host-death family antitoxin [Leptospiraceae bacterium]|nr:type II toxin-antitoxin system prevent-host-death family antitoxin [Leptospiraceae bacterium]
MDWKVATAKSQFSELIQQANKEPQVIFNRQKPSVVVLSYEEFNRLHNLDVLVHKSPKWAKFVTFSGKLADSKGSISIELPSRKDRDESIF